MGNMAIEKVKHLDAVNKLLISLAIAAIAYFALPYHFGKVLTHLIFCWDIFSLSQLIFTWITFYFTTAAEIREEARKQDDSRIIIFFIVLAATLISMLAVILLLTSKDRNTVDESSQLIASISCMLLSWLLVHTIFATRYAHLFYADHKMKGDNYAGGLEFPGDDKPDFIDFAYFSFTLGMTFQVSDVGISAKRLRRLALWHGLLSFGYNATIIALTINIIAGLMQ